MTVTEKGKIETPEQGTIAYVVSTDPASALRAIQQKNTSIPILLNAKRIIIDNLPYHFIILDQPEQS